MKERVQFLDAIRGYAIILVVATHALTYMHMEGNETLVFWVQTVAVPPFFLVDGYLFLALLQNEAEFSYGRYLLKSARRLVFPWVLFTVVYGVFRAVFEYQGLLETNILIGHSAVDIIGAAYRSEISPQMYFLPSLFVIRSVSFLTKRLATLPPLWILAIWTGYTILWANVAPGFAGESGLDPVFHALWGLQFYLLGMVLYVYRRMMDKYAGVYASGALVLLLALKLAPDTPPSIAQYLYIITVYFAGVAGHSHATFLSMLGKYTMGIFLFHAPIIIRGVSLLVIRFVPWSDLSQYGAVVVLTLAISLLVTRLCGTLPFGGVVLGEMPNRATI